MSDKTLALKLKDEGNAFFGASKFDEARAKYSEAIKLDENNAILYSNRAACHLNVKDYAAARNDAFKATEIDPKFSKAWTRLATAQQGLTQWTEAVHSWKQALAALPATNLSSAEAKQKAQYEAGLAQAEAIYQRMKKVQEDNTIRVPSGLGKMPWHLAQGMMDELIAAGYSRVNSSAWVIVNAYNDWKKGVARMKSQKPAPGMKGMLMGSTGALADLSNALLRDERVFHIEDQQFMTMYNQQVMIEVHATNAWTDGEPDIVIEQAIRRHQESGWDAVRKSMDVTVRAWIMRGFMTGGLTGDHGSTVSWLNKAIMLIEWGRSAGKSIDPASRGAIFKDTFLRGVRKLHMSAVLQAYGKKGGLDSPISLEDMYEEAEEVIREMKANPYKQGNEELDPGFVSSFIVYPKSQALSMKGFYHREIGTAR